MLNLRSGKNWLRLIGIALLALLLWRIDTHRLSVELSRVSLLLLAVAILLNIPQIFIKAFRWRWLLSSQQIRYGVWPATLAYFGSIFIGLLTPGRLGEFVKALHVSQDCGLPTARAFSSVLADRLFDLYALLLVGGAGLLSLSIGQSRDSMLGLAGSALLLTLPLAFFLYDRTFGWIKAIGLRLGQRGQRLFAPEGWLIELRSGLRQMTFPWLAVAVMLTILAYAVFFGQCYLLALALDLWVGFAPIAFAVALGSLVTLLPISVSGVGTREAAIIAYLGTLGVPAETALSFSLLVFLTFYVAGGLMGAVAWWVKPVPVDFLRVSESKETTITDAPYPTTDT